MRFLLSLLLLVCHTRAPSPDVFEVGTIAESQEQSMMPGRHGGGSLIPRVSFLLTY